MQTLTVVKACTGGYVGEGHVHPALLDAAREAVSEARQQGLVHDGYVARCGQAIACILTHDHPTASDAVHRLALQIFAKTSSVAAQLGQYIQHPQLNGSVAIDVAELDYAPRDSEPVLCFLAWPAGRGVYDLPLYRLFTDPLTAPSLLETGAGFSFVMADPGGARRRLAIPDDLREVQAGLAVGRAAIEQVVCTATGDVVAAASPGSHPALIVRCQAPFPSVPETLESFAPPVAVRVPDGRFVVPLMPVATTDDMATRLHGPARVIGLGFQVADGRLVGPRDLLGDRAFDESRTSALRAAEFLRQATAHWEAARARPPAGRPVRS